MTNNTFKASIANKCLIYTVIMLILMSAKHKPQDKTLNFTGFKTSTQLYAEKIPIPKILLAVNNICIVDSFMIVSQQRDDTIFSIFSLPDLRYKTSFGNKGRGPNEFFNHWPSNTLGPVYDSESSFAVGNRNTELHYYRVHDILSGRTEPNKITKLPRSTLMLQNCAYIADSVVIGSPFGGNMFLFKYCAKNDSLTKYSDYPNSFPLIDDFNRTNLFASRVTVKPDNSLFALVPIKEGRLELYNPSKNLVNTINYTSSPTFEESTGLNSPKKALKDMNEPSRLWFFSWEIRSSKKFIYIKVYATDHSKIYKDGKTIDREIIPEIHVFDWKGNPIISYQLDNFFHYFGVDPEDKYIFAIDIDIENQIFRYKL